MTIKNISSCAVAAIGVTLATAIVLPDAQAGLFDVVKEGLTREAKNSALDRASEATGLNMSCAAYTGSVDVMKRCMEYSVGNAITQDFGKMLSGDDLDTQESSVMSSIFTGEPTAWSNSSTGTSGEAEVVKEKTKTKNKKVVVLSNSVETVPALDLIGENYRASTSTNIRSGPGTNYEIVGALVPGNVVNVVGKITDGDWYLVGQGGVGTGYVFVDLLSPAPQSDATVTGTPLGDTSEVKVKAQQTCKTIQQSVTGADGTTKTEKVKACQGPNGWEIM